MDGPTAATTEIYAVEPAQVGPCGSAPGSAPPDPRLPDDFELRIRSSTPPEMPEAFTRRNAEEPAVCLARATVEPNGFVSRVDFLSCDPIFRPNVEASLRTMQFEPPADAGVTIPVGFDYRVTFRLTGPVEDERLEATLEGGVFPLIEADGVRTPLGLGLAGGFGVSTRSWDSRLWLGSWDGVLAGGVAGQVRFGKRLAFAVGGRLGLHAGEVGGGLGAVTLGVDLRGAHTGAIYLGVGPELRQRFAVEAPTLQLSAALGVRLGFGM